MGRLTAGATLALAAAAAGCATEYAQPPDVRFAAVADVLLPPPGPASDSGSFIILEEDDPFATEGFRRAGEWIETDLVVYNQVRVRTRARTRPDASVRRIELRLFPPDDDAPAFQSSAADLTGDSIRLEDPVGTTVETLPLPHRVVPEIDLSAAYIEQLLRRARALEAEPPQPPDSVPPTDYGWAVQPLEVPIWRPGSGNAVDTALVAFDADRATILIRETAIRAHTDPLGRLLAAVIPELGLYIYRR